HAHDWHAALLPALLYQRSMIKPDSPKIKSLLTVHNMAFQGEAPMDDFALTGLNTELFPRENIKFYGRLNLLKLGIIYSDKLTAVSPTYREETLTDEINGAGLNDTLSSRGDDYSGILNGIDHEYWSPNEDKHLPFILKSDWTEFKASNKQAMIDELKLSGGIEKPLIGVVSRLSWQKGIDLLFECVPKILKDANLVVLGSGNKKYEDRLSGLAGENADSMFFDAAFNEPLAHRIYAASDMFLIPSRYEPCGLTQMIALRYGSIPIVHSVGGLADTIIDYNEDADNGNGFAFKDFNKFSLIDKITAALEFFRDQDSWNILLKRANKSDFSWNRSAKRYIKIYNDLTGAN
ncbi:MAG: glycogen synthase, partial [FCB group bacterium]|nr:glycogen synthase [FCB group bacterium]